jgi:hypothetical protein
VYRMQVVAEIELAAILAFDSELSSASSNCGEAQAESKSCVQDVYAF